MNAGHIKGALLEYMVRELFKSCGFTNVKQNEPYTYEKSDLFYINGKGAAHDADVIMNPPIQIPFSYPTQLVFECKAYIGDVGLPIVRNAMGLRQDINEFEVVTKESLEERQNSRRAEYAIETRQRYHFQVGVAAVNGFTKPAIEFAANNKIPLLSLSWFLDPITINDINAIEQNLINEFDLEDIKNLYAYLKDRDGNLLSDKYERAKSLLSYDNIFTDIIYDFEIKIDYSFVGLLEIGDIIFMAAQSQEEYNVLAKHTGSQPLRAKIVWNDQNPSFWELTISDNENSKYNFFLPVRIMNYWRKFNLDKTEALNIKQEFFSRIFVFNKRNGNRTPFTLITIDKRWLDDIYEQTKNREG